MTVVDLCFPLTASQVARDHGYPLYAAITSAVPALHSVRWLGVHPIGGRPAGDELLLGPRSELRLRLPVDGIPTVLSLAGKRLSVLGSSLVLGAPVVRAIVPRPSLDARLVLLKLTSPPTRHDASLGRDVLDTGAMEQRYIDELMRQLVQIGVDGRLELRGRRSMSIRSRRLIGYSVRVSNLDSVASIRLQEHGLGGRRALGCGLFRATRGR
ncbi:MAG: type I-MYXAN CRISPR-associated protein Cas6/Cmx6 [Phycisphaerales bacterium]|nr:type I-MYXAN CRISPR-associated protein Cas6/Cmx6 [Phycisphaerales bacterium]